MKKQPNTQDKALAELLKKESYQAADNEWFTKRVLNRLPEKRRSTRWLRVGLYGLVIAGVFGCWLWYSHSQDTSVMTVRNLICYASMLCGCMTVSGIAIFDFIKSE